MVTEEKRIARLEEIEASFEIIEAICLIANSNAGKGQMDITLSVDGDNSGRVKISWKALARIVELARETLGDDGATDELDEAA
jgi:predicted ABC-type transport system involved in lysophospholipase L1 biosynthesis ATPase subunit